MHHSVRESRHEIEPGKPIGRRCISPPPHWGRCRLLQRVRAAGGRLDSRLRFAALTCMAILLRVIHPIVMADTQGFGMKFASTYAEFSALRV
ncbi:uncharacterized protein BDV14DRAFT_127174 [Aspergillus stella-maris]|uniref:uncharacterized protein n=1 Tax=Aspergillus stella-maris TaxID=1810926 RepID=UPI003CCD9448